MSKVGWAVITGILILVLLALGAAILLPFAGRFMGMGLIRPEFMGFGYPFFLTRGIGMFVFWLLIIGGAILIFQSLGQRGHITGNNSAPLETPLDILKRRYARGDITQEQFEEMKKTLGIDSEAHTV